MVKLIMLGKKIKYLCSFLLFLFISLFLYGENYKIFEINRSEDCYNLINAPVIPNSVTDMRETFYECSNLVTVSAIPNSVTV